ncbi:hypothetical protein K9M79_03420 [Candidatus Woesearchaeota archaeon]|nr:hypothetical protein [Candidatus Woesearchaeota archaeon]
MNKNPKFVTEELYSKNINAVNDNFSIIRKKVVSFENTINKLSGSNSRIESKLEALDKQMNNFDAEIYSQLSSLKEKIASQNEQLKNNDDIAELNTKIEGIEESLTKSIKKFDHLKTHSKEHSDLIMKVDALADQITNLDREQESVRADLEQDILSVNQDLASFSETSLDLKEIQSRLETLNLKIKDLNTDKSLPLIKELSKEIEVQKKKIDKIESSSDETFSQLNDEITSLQHDSTNSDDLIVLLNDQKKEIDYLKTEIKKMDSKIQNKDSSKKPVDIESFEMRIKKSEESVDEMCKILNDEVTSINKTIADLSDAKALDKDVYKDIDYLKNRLEKLEKTELLSIRKQVDLVLDSHEKTVKAVNSLSSSEKSNQKLPKIRRLKKGSEVKVSSYTVDENDESNVKKWFVNLGNSLVWLFEDEEEPRSKKKKASESHN